MATAKTREILSREMQFVIRSIEIDPSSEDEYVMVEMAVLNYFNDGDLRSRQALSKKGFADGVVDPEVVVKAIAISMQEKYEGLRMLFSDVQADPKSALYKG